MSNVSVFIEETIIKHIPDDDRTQKNRENLLKIEKTEDYEVLFAHLSTDVGRDRYIPLIKNLYKDIIITVRAV